MDCQVVKRRLNIIASHLGPHEDVCATATHLFPMSCSNSLNSIIRRCDNRMYFARQTSTFQSCFMRQVSNEQDIRAQSCMPSKSTGCENECPYACDAPMFSKPAARQQASLQNVRKIQGLPQDCNFHQPNTPDFPAFARPSRTAQHYHIERRNHAPKFNGYEWMPKMDVAESGNDYIVTLEIPGVSISNVRVEVNNQNLRVTGNRSIVPRKMANSCSINSISAYHKREISQGPYEIIWPLPTNVNKDSISAELVEGLLMITVPKLSKAFNQQEKAKI